MKYILCLFLFVSGTSFSQDTFQKAVDYYQKEKFKEARPLFQEYLNSHPNDAKTREYLGDIAGYMDEWDTAIEFFESLVSEEKNNANYQFKYGAALGMKALSISKIRAVTYIGDIRDAFETSAKLDPNHIDVRWALVEFYIQLPGIVGGSEAKAIKFANELGKVSAVDGFLANGYIAEYSDRPKDAEVFYKKAIKAGGSPHTYEKLATLYENNNQPKQAIETASKSLRIHKRNQLNYQIGKIAAQYNLELDFGVKCLQAYIQNHSVKDGVPLDWAYYRLAQIYKNQGDKHQAITWIDKALKNRPDFKEALQERQHILSL
ncbi:tetratricopeptide repeat protein [Ulvibacter litoralis]|uniref:Tetratricopeptide repeat-containing protein n=1 Tax=Ulvibacter litoralis TaxID=227084 RepID=A0A1G7BZX6_9FLAO|nr:tetratricopeptide repeat protein [Ulvibacter litoralis]SDE32621.1 Tetratricopeptide repeat-containing protein [Ulvibacter litoralis]